MDQARYWVVTASQDHAEYGKNWGIVQACHGKVAPLKRMKPGDGVTIYSPKDQFANGAPLQAFTAIGRIDDMEPYQVEMSADFVAWRRGVLWQREAQVLPIRPLLQTLEFTKGLSSWGMVFRYGLFQITRADFSCIARAMLPTKLHNGTAQSHIG